jgi:hypothetical protein
VLEVSIEKQATMMSSNQRTHGSASNLEMLNSGADDTLEYRIQAVDKDGAKPISLWHDVSLVHIDPVTNKPTPYLNFVCEIPKFSRKKYEIATDEVGNPIKQDEKKGQLREFKKGDIFFNYGCLPRTWEDPTFVTPMLMVAEAITILLMYVILVCVLSTQVKSVPLKFWVYFV